MKSRTTVEASEEISKNRLCRLMIFHTNILELEKKMRSVHCRVCVFDNPSFGTLKASFVAPAVARIPHLPRH